ncbi:hypothetical protein MLD38_016559 [Melastoma candidum]|uniref:Uncharacterized protein n=1 Tax=Melastoma candidum TaxID=119954 RepID=A0ACB9QP19_9MYRT|nr:hypothetical protein MLD38_016559 [Melastoma candidum]
MSGGGSDDRPPPQWPTGGEFLLSLLRNPAGPNHQRPPHHHGDNNRYGPPSAQHHLFPSQPAPLDPAVAAVGPAIIPSGGRDRVSPPWPPHGVSPPSQQPPPHLIYPHLFTAPPPGPEPNQPFVPPSGDLRGGDSGRTWFNEVRLPHQFRQGDSGSLGLSPVDGITNERLGFFGERERQARLLGAHNRDHVNSHQERRMLGLQGSSSTDIGFSIPPGYRRQNEGDSLECENQILGNVQRMRSAVAEDRVHVNSGPDLLNLHPESRKFSFQGSSSMDKVVSNPLGHLHRNEDHSREWENQIFGNVHRAGSAAAVDRVNGGRGEREFGSRRTGHSFEGSGEKGGSLPRNTRRERSDEDSVHGNGSGDLHLIQQLDRPGLAAGRVVHSAFPGRAEFPVEVAEDVSRKNIAGQHEKEDLHDLEEKYNDMTVGKDEADPTHDKNQIRHLRDKDFRSDPRGQHILSQKARTYKRFMQCRLDIGWLCNPLLAIYESLIPTEEEKVKQKQLLALLEKLVNKEWPEARLYIYGSCGNSFGVRNSDIDVCLEIQSGDIDKSELLLKLADILQSDNLQDVKALTRARVPIVKLMDPVTGISCDICVNNMLAVVNTKLLRDYAQIDVRLRQLAYIVKHWAKSRAVNETYQGTLSSYAYVLMCIHFLQQRRPPILPCLQELDTTYSVIVDDVRCAYFDQVEKLINFGTRNKENIAQLVWSFFHYWAYQHDYTNTVISVRTGHLLSKQSKDWTRRIGNDRHLICIEDPFDTSHDLGRVVDKFSIRVLREEFERAAHIMQHDPNPCATLFEPFKSPSSSEQPLG